MTDNDDNKPLEGSDNDAAGEDNRQSNAPLKGEDVDQKQFNKVAAVLRTTQVELKTANEQLKTLTGAQADAETLKKENMKLKLAMEYGLDPNMLAQVSGSEEEIKEWIGKWTKPPKSDDNKSDDDKGEDTKVDPSKGKDPVKGKDPPETGKPKAKGTQKPDVSKMTPKEKRAYYKANL